MHIPTHLMSGWCVANLFTLTPRERAFCMAAASLADLAGFSRLFGQEAYWDYHHVVCHNLAFALLMSAVLAACGSILFCAIEASVPFGCRPTGRAGISVVQPD